MPNSPFRDGDQVFVEMFLKNAKGKGDEPQPLNVMGNHIMDFTFKEQQGHTATFSMRLYDATFDNLEDVIFGGSALNPTNQANQEAHPVVQVKWGWVNSDRTVESPSWDMRLTKYNTRFILGRGTELEFDGWAAPGVISSRGNISAGAGTKITRLSELVQVIADKNGLIPDVEDGVIIQSIRQNGKNDFKWLKSVVQYAVRSDSGNKGYEVWIRNKSVGKPELVVRTQKDSKATQVWDYLYGVDRDGQVMEFVATIQSQLLFAMGSGGFRSVVFDPKTKEAKEFFTNSKSTPGVAGEGKFIPDDSTTPAPLRLGFQTEEAAKEYAASKYLQLNNTNVTAHLKIHGNPLITPSDLVNVIVLRGSQTVQDIRDIHPTSGSYKIKTVTHTISDGQYTTELDLFRRGNITDNSGGNQKTTGTEAAIEQIRKASDIFEEDRKTKRRKQIETFVKDPALKAEMLRRLEEGNF